MSSSSKSSTKRRLEMRNAPEEDPEFQIAPMIDILLVLLVFFMSISSTEALQVNQSIKLPVAKDAKAPKDSIGQQVINVIWNDATNTGQIDLNEVKYNSPSQITAILADAVMRAQDTRVLVRADRTVPYAYMRQVLKAVGDSTITNITFSVVDQAQK